MLAQPDEVVVRGSKRADQPVPTAHWWKLNASNRDQPIHEQIEELLDRVAAHEDRISRLLSELAGDAHPRLEIARHLRASDAPDTEEGGLGWSISPGHLQLLARLGAFIDVDEYDYAVVYDVEA